MYAIVRSGGKQHKVAVGDVLEVERGLGAVGSAVTLPALLLVDGTTVTSDAAALAAASVTAEVLEETKAKKINIMIYKNKTGYRRRMGHRQKLLRLRVTGIDAGTASGKSTAEKSAAAGEPATGESSEGN